MSQHLSSSPSDPDIAQITAERALEQAIAQVLQLAQASLAAGDTQGAIAHYKVILESIPDHHEANFSLGKLLVSTGLPEDALAYLEAAIQGAPQCEEYWDTYIDVLNLFGDTEIVRQARELRTSYFQNTASIDSDVVKESNKDQQVATAKASKAAATHKSGSNVPEINKLSTLYAQANFKEVERLSRKLIQKNPQDGIAWRFLGLVLLNAANYQEAEKALCTSLERMPDDAVAHFNFALALVKNKKFEAAETHYRKALDIDDTMQAAYNNLANLLRATGKLEEAESCLRKLLSFAPDFAVAHINLVGILRERKLLPQALEEALQLLSSYPQLAEAHHAVGSVLSLLDRDDEALPYLLRAIALKPEFAEAYNNIGSIYLDKKDFAAAKVYFEKALQNNPHLSNAHRCLGQISISLDSDIDMAEQHFRRAIAYGKNESEANTCLLFCLSETGQLNPQELFQEHLDYSTRYEAPLIPGWPQHHNVKDKKRVLRVGFVSGDFCNHAVATFAIPVLDYLSRIATLDLYAYDNNEVEDEVTKEIRSYFKFWRKINKVDDEVVAQQIVSDQIDILCDLSGHTAKNRLMVLAHKPAPVQLSWIGYPGTTGLKAMDYFIGDRFYLPEGRFDHLFTEKIVNLPCAAPFQPSALAPSVLGLPALENGYISFGSFNRLSKINALTIQTWSNLLLQVANSKILIGAMPSGFDTKAMISAFEAHGVAPERISFYGRTNVEDYLNLYNKIDICLDSFPFNGGTTTHHGLWMGVPTLSIDGKLLASRSAAAILGQVGMEGFLASDEEDFVVRGKYWCDRLDELAEIRMSLRSICENSIKCKPEIIADALYSAMRQMWANWCDGETPKAFSIDNAGLK
ncbi:tetratricopeptide repeat protein [Undibacterium sp. TJN19]|uniref:O-linked N-acetylglucosamine transferase family protein n=1 Tax=Undibacterium sp. TJN19 TaxID=3413055 RepID=UPI003BF414E9